MSAASLTERHAAARPTLERRDILWLAGILLLGAALRLYGIGSFSLQEDELYTLRDAGRLTSGGLGGARGRPLYYLLQWVLMQVAPGNFVAYRLLAVVFGVLGIWVTWLAARRLLGREAGVAASLLVAISPWQMMASGMIRYYSLLYLLGALAVLLIPLAYERDCVRDYVAALAVLVLGAVTHPTFLFPMVGIALALTLVSANGVPGWWWPSRRAWAALWIPFLALLAIAFLALSLGGHAGAVANNAGRGAAANLRVIPAVVEWISLPVAVAAALGAAFLLGSREGRARRAGAMALFGVGGTLVLLVLASQVTDTYADYFTAALPLVFIAAGGFVQLLASATAGRAHRLLVPAAVAVLAAGVLPGTISYLSDGTRFEYRPAFRRIQRVAPDLTVLTWPRALQQAYAPRLRERALFGLDRSELNALLAREGSLWAVVSVKRYGIVGDDSGAITSWLRANCHEDSAYERPRIDYRIYRVELWRCTAGDPATGGGAAGVRTGAATGTAG